MCLVLELKQKLEGVLMNWRIAVNWSLKMVVTGKIVIWRLHLICWHFAECHAGTFLEILLRYQRSLNYLEELKTQYRMYLDEGLLIFLRNKITKHYFPACLCATWNKDSTLCTGEEIFWTLSEQKQGNCLFLHLQRKDFWRERSQTVFIRKLKWNFQYYNLMRLGPFVNVAEKASQGGSR